MSYIHQSYVRCFTNNIEVEMIQGISYKTYCFLLPVFGVSIGDLSSDVLLLEF